MPDDDDHPALTVPRQVLVTDAILRDSVTEQTAVTKNIPRQIKKDQRPQVNLLYIMAPKENTTESRHQHRYGWIRHKASKKYRREVDSWSKLKDELNKYSNIKHLVLFCHGAEGALLIGDENRTGESIGKFLTATGTTVSRITIEGCMFGRDPVQMAYLGKGLKATTVTAYTWWHYTIELPYGPLRALPVAESELDIVKKTFFENYVVSRTNGEYLQIKNINVLVRKLKDELKTEQKILFEGFSSDAQSIQFGDDENIFSLSNISPRSTMAKDTVKSLKKAKEYAVTGNGTSEINGFIVTAHVNSIIKK